MKPLDEIDPLAQRMALVIRGLADEEVNRRVAEKVARLRAPQLSRDEKVMRACRAVADAVDRLEGDKYTSREISARQQVARAATALRNIIRERGAK